MKKFQPTLRSFSRLPKFLAKACSVVGFSILFLIPFVMKAQVYHPLVDSGAVWSDEWWALDWFYWNVTDYGGAKFLLDGDTTIDGLNYKALKVQGTYSFNYIGVPPYIIPGWGIDDSLRLLGGIREDSTRKVWFRMLMNNSGFSLPTEVDTLLYDFNLQVGDTFRLSSTSNAIVVSIDSIQLLNGEWRKRINFSSDTTWETTSWIEGIGSDGGLLANYVFPFESFSWLSCYKKNGELLYENLYVPQYVSLTCDSLLTPVGIEDLNRVSVIFEISPNPASDFLSINFSSPNNSSAKIKITDVLGRNLFSEEIKSNQPLQISTVKFLGNTMLFVQLWQDGKLIGVKKVLISGN